MTTIKFHSIELQKAYEDAEPILDNIREYKNMVSKDIKELEALLKSCNPASYAKVFILNEKSFLIGWNDEDMRLEFATMDESFSPLIEQKFKIREMCYPYLAQFLSGIK